MHVWGKEPKKTTYTEMLFKKLCMKWKCTLKRQERDPDTDRETEGMFWRDEESKTERKNERRKRAREIPQTNVSRAVCMCACVSCVSGPWHTETQPGVCVSPLHWPPLRPGDAAVRPCLAKNRTWHSPLLLCAAELTVNPIFPART